jgi:hypothetical protein
MVKVVDKSPEEFAREERLSKLVEIAKVNFPGRVRTVGGEIFIRNKHGSGYTAQISPRKAVISIDSPNDFEIMKSLAQSYEALVDPAFEWTLKKNYRES